MERTIKQFISEIASLGDDGALIKQDTQIKQKHACMQAISELAHQLMNELKKGALPNPQIKKRLSKS